MSLWCVPSLPPFCNPPTYCAAAVQVVPSFKARPAATSADCNCKKKNNVSDVLSSFGKNTARWTAQTFTSSLFLLPYTLLCRGQKRRGKILTVTMTMVSNKKNANHHGPPSPLIGGLCPMMFLKILRCSFVTLRSFTLFVAAFFLSLSYFVQSLRADHQLVPILVPSSVHN